MEIYEGKRHHQESSKSSRSPSPEPAVESHHDDEFRSVTPTSPACSRVGPPPSPPVPTHPIAPVPPQPTGPLSLKPCPICSRTFVPESLSKHVNICEKMTVKKRKTFDSSRQRREGTDLEQYLPKNFGLPENSPFLEKSPRPAPKPVTKPKPSVKAIIAKPSAELQRCPHCARTFGVRAFERHVEWCADKAKILPATPATQAPRLSDAKQRLDARTRYKAPPVRSRRTSTSRDKSSMSRSASVESQREVSPPREFGDYRQARRTSESVSSNDDHSPHVPVIRNTRQSVNSSFGDAHVKARQSRLARDLSNSSKQEPTPPSVQKPNTETDPRKIALAKFRKHAEVKKQEQLKKLEEIAKQYDERQQIIKEEKLQKLKASKEKSLIPKKVNVRKTKRIIHSDGTDKSVDGTKAELSSIPTNREKSTPKKTHFQAQDEVKEYIKNKGISKLNKESTMSLDSLEEVPNLDKNKMCHSIGINTELLCPCVPCVIHDNFELKVTSNKRKSMAEKTESNDKINYISKDSKTSELKIEILYKNPTMVSSGDVQSRKGDETLSTEDFSIHNQPKQRTQDVCDQLMPAQSSCNFCESSNTDNNMDINQNINSEDKIQHSHSNPNVKDKSQPSYSDETFEEVNEISEMFEEINERNVSTTFDDTMSNVNNKSEDSDKSPLNISRHGSGDTYTKFTENPADLEEFMSLTDKMITINSNEQINDIEKDVEGFHTPKTNSLEAINEDSTDRNVEETSTSIYLTEKQVFSETFDELKCYFKALLNGTGNNIEEVKKQIKNDSESAEKRKVSDMEHITIYEINSYEQKNEENNEKALIKTETQFKLPSISKQEKTVRRNSANKKRLQSMYKTNKKIKMLAEQDRGKKEYKTYIKDDQRDTSDERSISAEAPPLKLPRIDNRRIDDTYDPFASAARQMKELMSSETNIPKKLQNCSNSTRTLPILRPSREKSLTSLRADNTKMMKDSLNKTYQYQTTPTLQRMKSFGSTINDNSYTFGSRCSSFRNNKDDKKSSQQKLNTTFTKSSKENISTTDKSYFSRNSNLNRSFSNYTTTSKYSTPKPKDKIPKIATSMYHSFQRSTIKQPVKLDKITPKKEDSKHGFVNLDSILADSSMTSSMTDSNYIDPRLINENDNLPINVNSILNNSDMISSIESLLAKENLPAKFDSFHLNHNNIQNNTGTNHTIKQLENSDTKIDSIETNNNIKNNTNSKLPAPLIDDLSAEYDKIMSSLEQSINSKTSIQDVESVCEDFDLEEFIISFDDELHKQQVENKRTCSSTTRVIKQAELADSNKTSELNGNSSSPKVALNDSNGLLPINKSMSFNVNSNNVVGDNLFPFSVKRSTSLLESIQKKAAPKSESAQSRHRADLLEQDIMQSLKDFDKFYESEKVDSQPVNETPVYTAVQNGTPKRELRVKSEKKKKPKADSVSNGNHKPNGKINGNYTPNGKSSDSAYSSLNRISPSKLSVCTKDSNGLSSLDQIPAGSDSSGCQKDEVRSISSEEFLAMERSAELGDALTQPTMTTSFKDFDNPIVNDKQGSSRASSRRSNQWQPALSSSSSEVSLHRPRRDSASATAPRLSRFCHECGSKYPLDSAKFCIECGIKRLMV